MWSSVAGELIRGAASGLDRAAQEARDCHEFFLVQPRTDIAEPSLHPRIGPSYLRPAVAQRADPGQGRHPQLLQLLRTQAQPQIRKRRNVMYIGGGVVTLIVILVILVLLHVI